MGHLTDFLETEPETAKLSECARRVPGKPGKTTSSGVLPGSPGPFPVLSESFAAPVETDWAAEFTRARRAICDQKWPDDRRKRWGILANANEDMGMSYAEAEVRAFWQVRDEAKGA